MKILDRFTRDRVSRFLWGGATAVFLVLFLLAVKGGISSVSNEEQAAKQRAVGYTDTVLFGALSGEELQAPLIGQTYRDLVIEVQGGILTDPTVARVRVWAADGTLVFSTEGRPGGVKTTDTAPIDAALKGVTTIVIADGTGLPPSTLGGTDTQLYETFAPLKVPDRATIVAAAEIDQYHGAIVDAAAQPWRTLQLAFGIGFLLSLVLFLLSLRRSTTLIGAGVGFTDPSTRSQEHVVADEQNILRMRNELQRAKEENRKLSAHLAEAEAGMHLAGDAAPAGAVAEVGAGAAALRLAEVQGSLAAADAKTAELEHSLEAAEARVAEAEARAARSQAATTDPAVLASLEERVIAAEQRAREAELRLADLSERRAMQQEAPVPETPFAPDAPPTPAAPSASPSSGSGRTDTDEATPLRPAEAADLRSRLARTAARKKHGSLPDEEHR